MISAAARVRGVSGGGGGLGDIGEALPHFCAPGPGERRRGSGAGCEQEDSGRALVEGLAAGAACGAYLARQVGSQQVSTHHHRRRRPLLPLLLLRLLLLPVITSNLSERALDNQKQRQNACVLRRDKLLRRDNSNAC